MKKKLLLLALSLTLTLSACESADVELTKDSNETNAPDTQVTTTADPVDPEIPSTDEVPATQDDPSDAAAALAALLKKYPIGDNLTGNFASKTLEELLTSSTDKLNETKGLVLGMKGTVTMDMGDLGSMNEQIEVTYRTDGEFFEIITKSISDDGETSYVDTQTDIYKDGWYYSSNESSFDGESYTDRYKVQMTPEDFAEYILSAAGITTEDITGVTEFFKSAATTKMGMLEDGSCALLGTGFDLSGILEDMEGMEDEMGDMAEIIDPAGLESFFKDLKSAVVINENGTVKEIYIDLPLNINIDEEDLTLSMTANMNFTITIETPETVEISAPADADAYEEYTIDDIFGEIEW